MPESAKARRERLVADRNDRMLELRLQGLNNKEIAERFGLEDYYVGLNVRKLAKSRGIKLPRLIPRRKDANGYPQPIFGLDEGSRFLRAQLGTVLKKLRDDQKLYHTEISEATGLTLAEQNAAKDRPFRHDWTMSQIERLARQQNTTFKDFIIHLFNITGPGF